QPVRGDRSRADAVTSACADLPGTQALRGWSASRSCPPASASASPLGCCGCSCLTASAAASAGAGFGAGAGASNRLGDGAFSAAAAVEALLSAAVAAVSGFDRPAAPEVVLSTADSAASGRLVPALPASASFASELSALASGAGGESFFRGARGWRGSGLL